MSWVKLDDGFPEHPKVVGLTDVAFCLYIHALCYAARRETDGYIPAGSVSSLAGGAGRARAARAAAELVAAQLWHATGPETCERCRKVAPLSHGWIIHDFLEYNPSHADQERAREIAKRRWVMNHNDELRDAVRSRDGDRCRYCAVEVNWRDRRSPNGGTYDHILPVSKGGGEEPDNIAVCCRRCNNRKGGRTPEEADMPLLPPRTHPAQTRLIPDLHPVRTGTAPD